MNPAPFIKNLKENFDFEIYSLERHRQKTSKKLDAVYQDIAKLVFATSFFLKDNYSENDSNQSYGNSYFQSKFYFGLKVDPCFVMMSIRILNQVLGAFDLMKEPLVRHLNFEENE
jgi:hypothetical protein